MNVSKEWTVLSTSSPKPQEGLSLEKQAIIRLEEEQKAAADALKARDNSDKLFLEQQALVQSQMIADLRATEAENLKKLEEFKENEALRIKVAEQQLVTFYSQSVLIPSLVDLGKGLQNLPGENNCFLNVIVQSLYALPHFTGYIKNSNEHFHDNQYCIFCALKIIFTNFDFGTDKQIPPTLLREAMAGLYMKDQKFQLGKYADAAGKNF